MHSANILSTLSGHVNIISVSCQSKTDREQQNSFFSLNSAIGNPLFPSFLSILKLLPIPDSGAGLFFQVLPQIFPLAQQLQLVEKQYTENGLSPLPRS